MLVATPRPLPPAGAHPPEVDPDLVLAKQTRRLLTPAPQQSLASDEEMKQRMATPWNRGLRKETDPRVRRNGEAVSRALRGRPKSPEHRAAISRALTKKDSCPGGPRSRLTELDVQALQRDGYRCCECGRTEGLECHHIVPLPGGPDELENLATVCHRCHRRRHDWGGCFRPGFDPRRHRRGMQKPPAPKARVTREPSRGGPPKGAPPSLAPVPGGRGKGPGRKIATGPMSAPGFTFGTCPRCGSDDSRSLRFEDGTATVCRRCRFWERLRERGNDRYGLDAWGRHWSANGQLPDDFHAWALEIFTSARHWAHTDAQAQSDTTLEEI